VPDVFYFDPMFDEDTSADAGSIKDRTASADRKGGPPQRHRRTTQSKREMQFLAALCGPSSAAELQAVVSCCRALRRPLVMKRPKWARPIETDAAESRSGPSQVLHGTSMRYDCY
jgi:hypothetical protein